MKSRRAVAIRGGNGAMGLSAQATANHVTTKSQEIMKEAMV